jgi:hypothetical protein
MSQNETPNPVGTQDLDITQAEQVGGGDICPTAKDLTDYTAALKEAYDNLVDFTSYVIERVAQS